MLSHASREDEQREAAQRASGQFPLWMIVYGSYSRQFTCFPRFTVPPGTVLAGRDLDVLAGKMREIERQYPARQEIPVAQLPVGQLPIRQPREAGVAVWPVEQSRVIEASPAPQAVCADCPAPAEVRLSEPGQSPGADPEIRDVCGPHYSRMRETARSGVKFHDITGDLSILRQDFPDWSIVVTYGYKLYATDAIGTMVTAWLVVQLREGIIRVIESDSAASDE